jgi:hypothetical protein
VADEGLHIGVELLGVAVDAEDSPLQVIALVDLFEQLVEPRELDERLVGGRLFTLFPAF